MSRRTANVAREDDFRTKEVAAKLVPLVGTVRIVTHPAKTVLGAGFKIKREVICPMNVATESIKIKPTTQHAKRASATLTQTAR